MMMKNKERKKTSLMEIINPSEKQKLAFKKLKKFKFLLYGGAMYGGKSYWLRWALVVLLVYYFRKYKIKGVVVGLFCEDYPALKDRHLSKVSMEFPEWLGTLHSDHKAYGKSFVLSAEYGSGVIAFRNLDDPSKYASAEFAAIGVDELTKNIFEKFIALRHRLRWPGLGGEMKFLAGTNPGSIGHAWVKRYFMDRDFPPEEEEGDQFCYVPAKFSDNPFTDPSYEKTLNSLPEHLRRAFRDGDWDMFEGQYFDNWRREANVCKPFPIPAHWMKFIWMDYGYSKPSCVHWAALNETGQVFVYRELYVTLHSYIKLAKKVRAMTPEDEKIERMIADPAIFAKTGHGKEEDETAKSGADEMLDATDGWLSWERGNNDRINGWGVMRKYVQPYETKEGETTSNLVYFDTCKDAIRTIPALVYDSVRLEDVDTQGEDHAGDCDRYGIMDLHETFSEKAKSKPKEGTVDYIFERDMKAIKRKEEEKEENVDWMTL